MTFNNNNNPFDSFQGFQGRPDLSGETEDVIVPAAHIEDAPAPTPNELVESKPVETAIATVGLTGAVTETANFKRVLTRIPAHLAKANGLLAQYRQNSSEFLETVDEDRLDDLIKEMSEVSAFVKDVDKSKKDIRKYFTSITTQIMENIDERLAGADFGELTRAEDDIKQLKKDVSADRAAKRWDEIKVTFEANLARYPLFEKYAPELADFSKFKILNPKLISGAKTRKVREADHTFVNEELYEWNTALELIEQNEWDLAPQDQNTLLTLFKRDPGVAIVQKEGRQLKQNAIEKEKARIEAEKRHKEAEAKALIEKQKHEAKLKQLQEEARIAKEKRDVEAQKRAAEAQKALQEKAKIEEQKAQERRAEFMSFNNQYQTIFKESFPQFIEYMFSRRDYHDVHTNPATKATIIYDIMHQIDDSNSVVVRETGRNPQKTLDLVNYIMNA